MLLSNDELALGSAFYPRLKVLKESTSNPTPQEYEVGLEQKDAVKIYSGGDISPTTIECKSPGKNFKIVGEVMQSTGRIGRRSTEIK